MPNQYDILATEPALEAENMIIGLEELAEKLVKSGRLRVDQGERVNFVRCIHPDAGISTTFSARELNEPALLPVTMRELQGLMAVKYASDSPAAAESELQRLRNELRKHLAVTHETEMKVARLLVQSAHPAVIMLILWEEVEVFVSFTHSVGDMMDVEEWQRSGSASGLQATSGRRDYRIYVTAGGDPFAEGEYVNQYDGPNAKSRLMVIAGQEIGHFADILRDEMGRPVARHSSNIACTRASDAARRGRVADMARVEQIKAALESFNLADLQQAERAVEFYAKHRKGDLIYRRAVGKAKKMQKKFLKLAAHNRMEFVSKFPHRKEIGERLVQMLADMKFNLAPVASAYQNDNPEIEEAIACAEALARVPQQVIKWGHHATAACYPALYRLYYGEVIPAVVKAYETISGQKYNFRYIRRKKPWWMKAWRVVMLAVRRHQHI